MKNPNPTASVTDIATPAQSEALRAHQSQRLRDMAEALLQAFEATPVSKDYAGLDKAAKALISLNKMLKTLYEAGTAMTAKPDKAAPAQTPEDEAAKTEAQKTALAAWMPSLNLRLERLAEKRRAPMAAIPDFVLAPP